MEKIVEQRDGARRIKWCPVREYQIPLFSCLKCQKFPCNGIRRQDLNGLERSPITTRVFTGLKQRRLKLFIFKMEDGSLKEAGPDFSPDYVNSKQSENVAEIYVIAKTLIKQTRLVLKEKADIGAKVKPKN